MGETEMSMTIGAGEFKAKCLKLLDQVAEDRKPLVITKRGRPVAKLVPMEPKVELFGALRGSGTILGDIISPLENEWEVCQDE
jgi:prevent-host-death family protein